MADRDIIAVLTRVSEKTWRSLRATVRWQYVHWNRTPPPLLRQFYNIMPEDSQEWSTIAHAVQKIRHTTAQQRRREKKRVEAKRARVSRRDYQREYMRQYRATKRDK